MSHSSLPLTSKLFQLTSLTCALALAGCGGGDTVDVITPSGGSGGNTGGNTGGGTGNNGGNNNGGGNNGGEQTPEVKPDFFLQTLTVNPSNIQISDEPTLFTVTIKAVQTASSSAMSGQSVSLKINPSENRGAVTIEGSSTAITDDKGEATYELKLNPQAVTNEAVLLENGFLLVATATKSNGTITEQKKRVPVSKKGSGGTQVIISEITLSTALETSSVSNNILNPYGDTGKLRVIAKNKNGARVKDVAVGLAIASLKGVAVIEGSQVTDANGTATFDIKIDPNLTKADRDVLLQRGITYVVNIQEKNGATKSETGTLPIALPISDYQLSIQGNSKALNAYGDLQTLTINAAARTAGVPTTINGTKATIKLNETISGVSLSSEDLTLNSTGQANVDINIASTLSQTQREKLAKTGLSYTVTLYEPNKAVTTAEYKSSVTIPAAQYKVNFGSSSKTRLSSFGSSAVISFRVNDSSGGAVTNQKVTASLPKELTQKGLLTIDGDADQVTDNKGMVSYTVRVPAGLLAAQKAELERIGSFILNANITEASGASSQVSSEPVRVTAASETILNSSSVPNVINILKDQFQIQVSGKRPDGSAATGKNVKLVIDKATGVSIQGSEQITDAAGNAVFTVNLSQKLSQAERDALVASGISYTAILTDEDGLASQKYQAAVAVPVAQYNINFTTSSDSQLSSSGGSTVISFRVNDRRGGVIKNQPVIVSLPSALTDTGLLTLDSTAEQMTDDRGMVSYTVRVPAGLSTARKAELERIGGFTLNANMTESSGANSQISSERVSISNAVKESATVLSSNSIPNTINVLQDQFQIQVSGKRLNGSAAAGKVVKLLIDEVTGVSIQGNEQTTDAAGNAIFTVNLSQDLTTAQRNALVASGITYTAILTDDDGIATQKYKAALTLPVAQYKINFGASSNSQLSSTGGSSVISFRVNDKNGGVVANQSITAVLPKGLTDAGLLTLDSAATQMTDSKGMVSYTVRVPAGLSAARKAELERIGGFVLTAAMIESSGATSTISSERVLVTAEPGKSQSLLSSKSIPGTINVLQDQFQIQVSGKRLNGSAAAGKVVKLLIDKVAGVSVQGNEQTTDVAGNAIFTINLSQDLTTAQRNALVASGITYTAILTDDDGIATQNYKVAVTMPVAQYQINFGASSSSQLSSSGGSSVISFRVNDKNGGVIANQKVTASLPKTLTDTGLLTLESAAAQVTDDKGMVSYAVRIPAGLTTDQKASLEKAGGFVLTAVLVEASGASSSVSSERLGISDAVKESATILSSKSIPGIINVLKDQFQIQVSGKRPNGSAAAGKVVKLEIDKVAGVSVQGNEQTTDAAGNAIFTINLSQDLTTAQRDALVASGITYTAILTDQDGIATQKYKVALTMPVAQYKINFGTTSNVRLSSSGGSSVISFRVNDKNGGVIANQKVTASLPKELTDAGLLTLDSAAEQVTDNKGMVSYTVRVPAGLTPNQKISLEEKQGFVLNAVLTEASGANSSIDSERVRVTAEPDESQSILSSKSIPGTINVLKDQFQIQVSGKRPNGSAAAGKVVKLVIDKVAGISVQGNEQTTDAAGNAVFTINLSQDLTLAQREALVASGITYTAILTDDDGIATQKYKVAVTMPVAQYKINFGTSSNDQLSSSGGSSVISFRVNDKNGGVIANQNVTASLPKILTDTGLLTLESAAVQVTDNKGMVSYTVRIPAGLSAAQKTSLEKQGSFVLTAVLAEASGASSSVSSEPVSISDTVKESATILSSKSIPGVINVLKDQFQIQVSGKRPNGSTAAGKVVKLEIDEIAGVSVQGNEQTTDAAGNAIFTINLSQDLTKAQRDALVASGITYTAILTDNDGIATQKYKATVTMPVAQYQINFNQGNQEKISVYGGNVILSFRVNDKNGGVIANQKVTASLPKELNDAGLLTLDGGAEQVTNEAGFVNYLVRIPQNLSNAQKLQLEGIGDFALTVVLTEASGATSSVSSERVSFTSASETILSSKSIPGVINVLKDQFQIQVSGKRPNGSAAAGKVVKLEIDEIAGVSVQGNEQTTDAAGNAIFTVNLSQDLTAEQRDALVASGVTYTAILTDEDGIATQKYKAAVTMPVAQYQINFGTTSNVRLSSSGGSSVISFRVNDKNGGVIANQNVTASLPKDLVDAGLLTLDSEATQRTDNQGMVRYNVRVPAGLTDNQRRALEGKGKFVLKAILTETSGATNSVDSEPVLLSNEVQRSATTLSSKTIPAVVNVLKDKFQIQVSGKRPNGSAAAGKVIKLDIDKIAGVSIQEGEQTTDAAGNTVFTINIAQNITAAQRDALVASGITYTAILTDEDGIATQKYKAAVTMPVAQYQINFGTSSNDRLSSSGGSSVISFRVNDKNGGVIANQNVTASLPKALADAGLLTLSSKAAQVTDDQGMVSYTVRVPAGLNDVQRKNLEAAKMFALTATLTEESGVTSTVTSSNITISDEVKVSATTLSSKSIPGTINVFRDQFQIQVSGKRPNGNAAAGKVVELVIDKVAGVSIQGNEQTTDAAGNAIFTVNLSQDLTAEQRDALVASGITYTAYLTDDDGIATQKYKAAVTLPVAQYQINFGTSSNTQLSSSGGSSVISFRVNDKKGGVIANQRVSASLPPALTSAGLLTLDGETEKTTDNKGMVSYTVRVPAGLNDDQKTKLEAAKIFVLKAVLTETSGASSTVNSGEIKISDEVKVSATTLSSKTIPGVVNVLKDQFQIQVSGKRLKGAAAAGKVVKLMVNDMTGISVQGNEKTTDAAGNAVFTINIDPSLSLAQRQALVGSVITYTAILTDDDGIATLEDRKVQAEMPTAEYKINFGTTTNPELSSSGGSTIISFRVNDSKGGIVANQEVIAVLPKNLIDAGLLTLDSAATQVTDNQGMVSYTVRVPAGLSAGQKTSLEQAGSFVLTADITEKSGASSSVGSAPVLLSSEVQKSVTVLTSTTTPSVVNLLKDRFEIKVSGKRKGNAAAAGKVVKLMIDNVTGVSAQDDEQTTDAAGNAVFIVNIDPNLTLKQREDLVASGITYSAILTDDDGIATVEAKAQAAIPGAEYQINFGTTSNSQLSSSGGMAVISFRVNDKNGGVIANQNITASLPTSFIDTGLLTLDGEATQVTDNKGMVNYTVRVPAGLTANQKTALETKGQFALKAILTETSGATSTVASSDIRISDEIKVSATTLSSKSIPDVINVLKNQFQIQVSGKRPKGAAAAGKVVKLMIDDVTGISVQGNEQTTDAAGNAVFTINIDPSLSLAQRQALVGSVITYSAILTDDDGIATLEGGKVEAEMPTAEYKISFGTSSNPQLSSSGGSTIISFRVNDKNGGVVADQSVTALLPEALTKAGLLTLDGEATQVTDNQGMVRYSVRVPAGLTNDQKRVLEAAGGFELETTTVEASGAISEAVSERVRLSNEVQRSETVLSSKSIPGVINVLKDQFQIQVSGKGPKGAAAAGKVVKLMINDVTGISIQGNEQTTDAAGNAVFTINIDPSLSLDQRKAFIGSVITYTAILTDDDGIATLEDGKVQAQMPTAEYKISFGISSSPQLSSSGGSTIISFRVNDKNGGVVADQPVTAVLPEALTEAGLLTLDGEATQITNNQGMVRYSVRVPAGLTNEQKRVLETAGGFELEATTVEASGAISEAVSERVRLSNEVQRSETVLSSKSIPGVINVLKNQFQIQVSGKRPKGAAAAGKVVKLMINDVTGISVQGNEQTTDAAGNAVFTINIDPSLSLDQRQALVGSVITYTAILTDEEGIATLEGGKVEAEMPTAEYKISFGTSSNPQLSSSGGSTIISFRVNDKNGGVVADQSVTALLPEDLTKAGLLTLDGAATQVTDNQGMVRYSVRVPAGLTNEQKRVLEVVGGFELETTTIETSGAISEAVSERVLLSNEVQRSETVLSSKSIPGVINVLKNQFQIQVSGKGPKGAAAAGKVVKLMINDVTGISIQGNEQTTDAAGNAVFTINIDPSLSLDQRKAFIGSVITYTAILTDDDGIATLEDGKVQAGLPNAEYQINFGTSSKVQLSSSGGSTVISFRVNDKNGGVVDKQTVIASLLPEAQILIDEGLLTIDGNVEQTTDAKGMVSYSVRVPAGLSAAQKKVLEAVGSFTLNATAVEASGANSRVSSTPINIGSAVGQSDIKLTSTGIPKVVTVTDTQFKIQVSAKRPDSSAAAGNVVKLVIKDTPGVTIEGNEQTTNAAGNAVFTVNISQDLTENQRNTLVASDITYTATLTDADGTQAEIANQVIDVVQPATSIEFASIINPSISELGGSGNVRVKLVSKTNPNKPIEGQSVVIKLEGVAETYGVTVSPSAQPTDFNGEATFVITIPENLTAQQRTRLKRAGINYQLSYIEKDNTYTSTVQQVDISTPAVDLTVLNVPNLINNRPFYTLNGEGDKTTIQVALSTQMTSFKITGQPIELAFKDKALAELLNVNGKLGSATNIVSTNTDGISSFTVIVPSNLTPEQKDKLQNQRLTATLTETLTGRTQEIQFNVQSTKAAIDLIPIPPKVLNLNGGETQIEVIAQDSKENVIAGQKVFLALPAAIASQGVILATSGTQITDDSGKATFIIAVPAGLSAAQKAAIGRSFKVALTAADANGNIATNTSTVTTSTPAANGTQENVSIGANKVVNTKGDTFKVFVRVANNEGSINNREVRLNVDDPIKTGVSVTNGTATTNSDGVATFDLKLEDGANVNQAILEAGIKLTATTTTAENVKLEQNYIVAVDTATIDSYQILASSDKSTLNTGGDQTNAIFRVTDSSGGILVGVPVQLSIENLAASGAALTTPSMVRTDATGQIDVGVLLAANSINARLNHSVVINAKIVTPQYDASGTVSMQVREENSLSLSAIGTQITLAASATQLKDGENTTITTTLIDGSGRAIANAGMELVDATGKLIATNVVATTNADGNASFTVREDALRFDSNGNLRIFARALGEGSLVTQRSLNSIDLVKVSQAGISFSNIIGLYDVMVPNDINIQIRTDSIAQANALIGKMVEVQTTIGTFVNDKVITTRAITANDIDNTDRRIINVPVQLTSELAGITVLQATVLGEMANGTLKYQTTVDTRFRATTPAKMLFQAVKSVITPGTSTEVVATVKDKNDVPVEGQTVVFSRAADSSAGRLSAATAVTDSKGQARVVYLANASSPIGGVVINARLLTDNANIGTKTTNITVSKEAVYTTLAFSNVLSSDNIYYTAQASISVMDGSGRAVPNREVSIKSYAIEYAQGRVCLLESSYSYLGSFVINFTEQMPVFLRSNWLPTEDPEYNYTLDKDADININNDGTIGNGRLDPINPVAIIGGTVSGDGYTFVTDDEGRADFNVRYPLRYSNWTKIRFDASTFVNGSENTQSINYVLPSVADDINVVNSTLVTPWVGDASPFGTGGARCATSMSVTIDPLNQGKTTVRLSPYDSGYSVRIDGKEGIDDTNNKPENGIFKVDFDTAYNAGSIVNVSNNGFSFSKTIKLDDN